MLLTNLSCSQCLQQLLLSYWGLSQRCVAVHYCQQSLQNFPEPTRQGMSAAVNTSQCLRLYSSQNRLKWQVEVVLGFSPGEATGSETSVIYAAFQTKSKCLTSWRQLSTYLADLYWAAANICSRFQIFRYWYNLLCKEHKSDLNKPQVAAKWRNLECSAQHIHSN